MKHSKRNEYQNEISKAVYEYYCDCELEKEMKKQISQTWKLRNQEETERIKRQIDCAYEQYYLEINTDNMHQQDEKGKEQEVYCQTYHKNMKRAVRRKKSNQAKKRLIKKLKIAEKNLAKRFEEDLNKLIYHSSDDIKSRVERYNALNKRVKRFQR